RRRDASGRWRSRWGGRTRGRRRGGRSRRGGRASCGSGQAEPALDARPPARSRDAGAGAGGAAVDAQAQRPPAGGRRRRYALEQQLEVRFSQLPLLWRVFAINATLLVIATLVLLFARERIHASLAFVEGVDVAVGLGLMLTANLFLLRHTLRPIE